MRELPSSTGKSDEIDLQALLGAIWRGKMIVLLMTLLFSCSSVFYAISLPDKYRSVSILAPASGSSSSSLSQLAGQFGGLASLAGVNLGGNGGADKATIALELMKTWGFLEEFIESADIAAEVYAVTGWNKSENKLIYDLDIYDPKTNQWLLDPESEDNSTFEPSSWELYRELSGRLLINRDKETGLIRISLEHFSPHITKQWSNMLVEKINQLMKEEDKASAKRSIKFLKSQVANTHVADMQTVFYQLIEEQAKTLMLAEVSNEYVLKTVSAPKVPEVKSGPNRALICIVGFMLGSGIGIIFVLIRLSFNSRRKS
ncbi:MULTISPECIES: Wzz/FepE/Etk N-terminal domain-containing protein [unclassified Oleiphilus]|uniref:Wzz/FepE/Etk N-terminal domain-containing protein n=1 Tax=unclassified Oleiphilus TaxID=2631174 RepID=UPI0007C403E3|nr:MULTISPECIES: Wzz/FepE/Etk N-terminal domain-containing protein [unclassified Oleiphilus]KZY30506.1 hypothetical protein A3729_10665 [Oleiphilus sp. HI0043]KZZ68325.1 hypothetical protein A3763_14540 [Oleiphilus sp. HI0128]